MLAFHGFGQGKEVFNAFADALSTNHTVYTFDLFFHGKSEWNYEDQPLEKEFWKEIIQQFLTEENIQSFSVIGYSMGGKFALATLEAFSPEVKEVYLLAPDGIWISPWYSFATASVIMRNLFKSMVIKPKRFQLIANVARTLGLIDKSMFRFTETQMNTEEKREQVYRSWITFRKLKFDMDEISANVNSNNISVTIIIGKHDKIFPAKKIKRLLHKIRACRVEVLDSGHNGLIRKSIPLIQSIQS
jgi:pimeloyl-ACP methyl ester carboxylesterase